MSPMLIFLIVDAFAFGAVTSFIVGQIQYRKRIKRYELETRNVWFEGYNEGVFAFRNVSQYIIPKKPNNFGR